MYPIHDHDPLVLLATALAAKRRPAALLDVMSAIDLVQGIIPNEEKLSEAFARLGRNGLLLERDGGVALTTAAESLIEALPHKGDMADRLMALRNLLVNYVTRGDGVAVAVAAEQLQSAIEAHRSAAAGAGKNMLVPKPKPEANQSRPGQRLRKPMPKQRKR
jgi:hypothetical protein